MTSKLIIPKKIETGCEVRIVSSARAISKNELEPAVSVLNQWGFSVSYGKSLHRIHDQFAGTDEERVSDLQDAINDQNVCVILFARGGYGTVRIIDGVDFSPLRDNPKWLVGYSDITVIHNHLHNNVGLVSLHATMPINFGNNTLPALNSLKNCIENKNNHILIDGHPQNRLGSGKGQVIGGNLSILYSLMGSPSDIDTDGKILFIEDLDEYLYHIDRIMMNLKRAGKLEGLVGLIVGAFTKMNDNDIPFGKNAHQIILGAVSSFKFPVVFNFPSGHIDDNHSLYFGLESTLTVGAKSAELVQII